MKTAVLFSTLLLSSLTTQTSEISPSKPVAPNNVKESRQKVAKLTTAQQKAKEQEKRNALADIAKRDQQKLEDIVLEQSRAQTTVENTPEIVAVGALIEQQGNATLPTEQPTVTTTEPEILENNTELAANSLNSLENPAQPAGWFDSCIIS